MLIAPRRRFDGYHLLYHLEALQLSFFSFSPPFFSTLSKGYVTLRAGGNSPTCLKAVALSRLLVEVDALYPLCYTRNR